MVTYYFIANILVEEAVSYPQNVCSPKNYRTLEEETSRNIGSDITEGYPLTSLTQTVKVIQWTKYMTLAP